MIDTGQKLLFLLSLNTTIIDQTDKYSQGDDQTLSVDDRRKKKRIRCLHSTYIDDKLSASTKIITTTTYVIKMNFIDRLQFIPSFRTRYIVVITRKMSLSSSVNVLYLC
jgi:hypothetical protein